MWWIAQLRSTSRMHAVGADERLGQVALLVLDDRQLTGAVDERRVGREPFGEPLPDAVARSSRRRSSNTSSTSASPPIARMAASSPMARPS